MADTKQGKGQTRILPPRRVRMDTSNLRTAYCNYFSVHDNREEVVLNFGFNDRRGSAQQNVQIQILQQIILHPATARRVKDTLVAIFKKRDRRVLRVAQTVSPKKPN